MKQFVLAPLAVLLVLAMVRPAPAEPAWGSNCLSCHGQWQTSALRLLNYNRMADPNESATGAPDRGSLKVFDASRGHARNLRVEVTGLAAGDMYAVQLKRLRYAGVETGGHLDYAADCAWPEWGESAYYYTQPDVAYTWGTDPTTSSYEITIEPTADDDYYDLVFAVAGKFAGSGELYYGEEHFYLHVGPLLGDMNCDGVVNFTDINAFVLALTGEAAYRASYPNCRWLNADCDGDGLVSFADINPFVALLSGS